MRPAAGGEYMLEMCQQLQLNCCMRIWDFPVPIKGNSFSLDFFINSLSFLCSWNKLVCLVTHSETFQCNSFWMRWSARLLGVTSLDKTVHVRYSFQVLDATLVLYDLTTVDLLIYFQAVWLQSSSVF